MEIFDHSRINKCGGCYTNRAKEESINAFLSEQKRKKKCLKGMQMIILESYCIYKQKMCTNNNADTLKRTSC